MVDTFFRRVSLTGTNRHKQFQRVCYRRAFFNIFFSNNRQDIMNHTSPIRLFLSVILIGLTLTTSVKAGIFTPQITTGALSEIRFRPFVYLRVRSHEVLADLERLIITDHYGQLVSVGQQSEADFFVAFVSQSPAPVVVAQSSFALPAPEQITSDHTGQMIVYTKTNQGQIRIVWKDEKGRNRPGRAMLEFLRELNDDKQALAQLPIQQLNAMLAANESGVETVNDLNKPKFISPRRAKYNEAARIHNVSGTVVTSVILNADGEVSDLYVIKGLPHGLTASCIEALKQLRFVPAMRDGKPVSVRTHIIFTFQLY